MVQRTDAGSELIRLAWPDVGAAEAEAVAEVLESGQLTMGPKVDEFERGLAAACGTEHAVVVSSGTAALHLAVLALGIGPGDEVLVPAYTFPSTANVVAFVGANPVHVDADPETMNLDPQKLEPGPRTKAIVAVDLFGRPARIEQLPKDVPVLEDAAGALGAKRQGRPCGSLGALACLSFHPRSSRPARAARHDQRRAAAERVRSARHHGWSPPIATTTCRAARPTTASRHPLRDRDPAGSAARTPSPPESASPPAMPTAAGLPVRLPGADEGDRHGWWHT